MQGQFASWSKVIKQLLWRRTRPPCLTIFSILISTFDTDSSLVEIARRKCNNECGHDQVGFEKSSQIRNSATNSDIARSTKPDKQPCARHYKKARVQYGAVLDNLGCICKVLLSLDIESCCALPAHVTIRHEKSNCCRNSS